MEDSKVISLSARFASESEVVSPDQYLLHRIRHGVPEGVQEIVPMQAFPMESNLDLMGASEYHVERPLLSFKISQSTSGRAATLAKNLQ